MAFSNLYLRQASDILSLIDTSAIEQMVTLLARCRENNGRLFIIGSGGGAGHASHAVCDFRKVCGFQAYCPTDNISELTARINDDGWDTCISNWLLGSQISTNDCLLIFSVGGGSVDRSISLNLVNAVKVAKKCGATVVGVVGRDGGFTAEAADACVIIPTVDPDLTTPHTESFQALIWHLLISHPTLQLNQTKWESTSKFSSDYTSEKTEALSVKIFADGADRDTILKMRKNQRISGFTTNPSLMKKAGVAKYRDFALDVLSHVGDLPISFEVLSDDFNEMEREALEIAKWGDNVYVKVPISNTKGQSSVPLIERLSKAGVKVNVTAVLTLEQIRSVIPALIHSTGAYVSVFAGRIADTGRDPVPLMREAVRLLKSAPQVELIWASPRELLNIFQANHVGCHIITVTGELLSKLPLVGRNLNEYSIETVEMFYRDASAAGFTVFHRNSEPTVEKNP